MKTQNLIVAAAVLLLAACASQTQDTAATSTTTGGVTSTVITSTTATGTGSDPTVTGYSSGSTASLTLNGSALGRLFYNSQPIAPTNPRINIDTTSNTQGVIISYVESGVLHSAVFGTQHPTNSSVSNQIYNGWVTEDSTNVWKGFFQDSFGAIVLVLDKSLSQTDGTSSMILGGSVWFQNFQQSAYQNPLQGPLKMCWEITAGPYDCRSFLVSGKVNLTSSLYPNNSGPDKLVGYEKLGDFGGISRTAAGL